jgi:hypothetical protein
MILIEYNGQQHYKPHKRFFGGEKGFQELKKRDEIKQAYCKARLIPLIVVPYWQFDNLKSYLAKRIKAVVGDAST